MNESKGTVQEQLARTTPDAVAALLAAIDEAGLTPETLAMVARAKRMPIDAAAEAAADPDGGWSVENELLMLEDVDGYQAYERAHAFADGVAMAAIWLGLTTKAKLDDER